MCCHLFSHEYNILLFEKSFVPISCSFLLDILRTGGGMTESLWTFPNNFEQLLKSIFYIRIISQKQITNSRLILQKSNAILCIVFCCRIKWMNILIISALDFIFKIPFYKWKDAHKNIRINGK